MRSEAPAAATDGFSSTSRVDALLRSKLEDDEAFAEHVHYLHALNPSIGNGFAASNTSAPTERRMRVALEERELELNGLYLDNFQRINEHVQSFVSKIRLMNSICNDLTTRIQSNKEKTRDLLGKTSILQAEKRELTGKKQYLDDFLQRYSLTDDESAALAQAGTGAKAGLSDAFFKAFRRLLDIAHSAGERVPLERDNLALLEIHAALEEKTNSAYATLHRYLIEECRLLSVAFTDLNPAIGHAFELLQSRPAMLENALSEYAAARRNHIVRAFIDAMTKGAARSGARGIEQLQGEPAHYVNEILTWVHSAVCSEREIICALFSGGRQEAAHQQQRQRVLTDISDGLCQSLKLRVEQAVTKEGDCVVLFRLSCLFLHYAGAIEREIGADALLTKFLMDVNELSTAMFFGVISSSVQRILSNMGVPDYDLLPVNSVHQALLLLRDVLESLNDGTLASNAVDKKAVYAKIFAHILDPLNQSIQLVCSNLSNPLDVATYMLNCLNAVRSVIILYQFTDAKLEMIKAQMDANEDVLVSEQASQVLVNCDMMDVYTKSLAHQPNQGPLAKIAGMEPERVSAAIAMFNEWLDGGLDNKTAYQCNQTVKISSARIRESVQSRTFENVISAYRVIHAKLASAENGYGESVPVKAVEEVEKILMGQK